MKLVITVNDHKYFADECHINGIIIYVITWTWTVYSLELNLTLTSYVVMCCLTFSILLLDKIHSISLRVSSTFRTSVHNFECNFMITQGRNYTSTTNVWGPWNLEEIYLSTQLTNYNSCFILFYFKNKV